MLSYKEYKLLNESLYNLGIRSPEVISEPIGKTGATETLEEAKAKKCMKMKKGMEGDCGGKDHEEDEEMDKDVEEKDVEDSESMEDSEEKEMEDSDSEEKDVEDEKVMMMKKKMKKKSKKEWSELESDLDALVEEIENPSALIEVKKGVEMIKKGMKKCGCSESNMSDEYKAWWNSVNSMIGDIE